MSCFPSWPANTPRPLLAMCNVRRWYAAVVSRNRLCLRQARNSIRCTIDLTAYSWPRINTNVLPTAWARRVAVPIISPLFTINIVIDTETRDAV